jgi:5''-3'' exonuclease (including N-terminal domain of PolI)
MKRILTNRQKSLIKPNFPKGINFTEARDKFMLPAKRHIAGSVKTCLVVDGMNIAYQAFYAYAKLSHQGKSTSILYGFINILRPILKQFDPVRVVVCWDGVKHPERLKTLPTYKGHREAGRDPKKRKKFLKQIERTRKLLYYLGISQAYNPNIEGDDMIYWVSKRMQKIYRTIIVSGDKDFKQLINHDVSVYNPRNKYLENIWAFPVSNYGVEVAQYKDFLCLTGDKSDDIPGYPNIGEKRAASLLTKYYSIKDYLESKEDLPGLTDKEKLKGVYLRNNKMINLRYFNEKYNKKVNITYYRGKSYNPGFNEIKYKAYCLKYGLKTSIFPLFLEPFKKLNQ